MQNIEDRIKQCMSVANLTQDIDMEINFEDQPEIFLEGQQQQQQQQQQKKQLLTSTWEVVQKNYSNELFNKEVLQKQLFVNLSEAYEKLNQLHVEAQEFTRKLSDDQQFEPRFCQAIKITLIGIMQLEQIGLISYDKNYMDKSINDTYNIKCNNLNQNAIDQVIDFMITYILSHLLILFEVLSTRREKYELRQLIIYLSKLQTIQEQLPGAAKLDINDIFCYDRSHQLWQPVRTITKEVILSSRENINKSYNKIAEGILLANAMIAKGAEFNKESAQQIMQGFGAMYYLIAKKDAKSKADHFMAEPNKQHVFKAWNLGETGLASTVLSALIPFITYDQKIYIPYLFKRLVDDNILNQYKEGLINKIQNDCDECQNNTELPQYNQLYKKDDTKIQVRIICEYNLQEIKSNGLIQNSLKMFQGNKIFESIIIHIHGGGFVSMSSRSHQTYTNKWAKNLEIPIFSIDYRKAPENPYPYGLDDCWQAYMFIINYIDKYFNIKPKKIVLVGDSAGGNLVAALTVQIIKSGARIPDGILLAYPALQLDIKHFTPSLLVSLNDPLLHHTLLKLCIESYVPEKFDAKIDPLISPSVASDDILKRFPKTRIILGTNDPLHDESFRLANKLLKLNKDVQILEYKWMPHGFLQFDVPQGMKEAEQTVKDAENILLELTK